MFKKKLFSYQNLIIVLFISSILFDLHRIENDRIINSDDMKTHVPITHVMTSQVFAVERDTELREVEKIMKRNHFRHVPVVENGDIIGIVSLTDLQRLSYNASFAEDNLDDDAVIMTMLSLDQIMVRNPFCVKTTATVGDVVDVLLRMDFHAVPVCEGKELMGIVTTTDLLKYFIGK